MNHARERHIDLDPPTVLRAHGPLVWGLCRRLATEPEDAYQAIWEKVFRALDRFDPDGRASLRTWIATIAHRHLVDRHRRRKVRGQIEPTDDLPSIDPAADEQLQARQRRQRLERALKHLPVAQRRAVVLHHLNEVSLAEIAATEEVTVGTIKSRLHRGRKRLAELLAEEA